MSQETIVIEAVSRNGVMSGGKWYNFGRFSKTSASEFLKGSQYTVDVTAGKNGGVFINNIMGEGLTALSKDSSTVKSAYVPVDREVTNKRILYQGIWQAVLQSPIWGTQTYSFEGTLGEMKKVVDSVIKDVEERLAKS